MEYCNSSKEVGHPGLLPGSRWLLEVTIILLPFAMFFWMIPFISDLIIGNDYTLFPIRHQMELMFSLETGSFPLYVPGFAGGQSSSALTLGQLYHPLSYLAFIMPGFWQGQALEWMSLLRLLTLGFAHLALYRFLRKIRIGPAIAFLLSVITVYNLRMLDLFRYGASLETWSGLIFLCSAIGWSFLEPKRWLGSLCIIGSIYWVVCSGHPQMMYYSLIAAALFALTVPYLILELIPEKRNDSCYLLHFWIKITVCCLCGILLSFSYIAPFYFDFLKTNGERVVQSYQWADGYRDTLVGTLNNFFLPLRSDVHGAFGGSPLVMVAALTPVLYLFKIRIPRVIWMVWGMVVFTFLHMQGARTPIHYLVWKFVPFYSSFRIAGRISLLMPILNLLLLIWIFHVKKQSIEIRGKRFQLSPQTILAGVSILAIGIYIMLPDAGASTLTQYSAMVISGAPLTIERFLLLLGVLTLFNLALHGISFRVRILTGTLVCLLSCLNLMGYLRYGTWIEAKKNTPSLAQLLEEKHESLYFRGFPGIGLINKTVIRQIQESCLEPYLGKVYCAFEFVDDTDRAYAYLARGRPPDMVVIEKNSHRIKNTTKYHTSAESGRVSLAYSSFNRLVFNVQTACPGFFVLSYPHTGHWQASINQRDTDIFRANGAAHAVEIPAGESRVEFRYWSPAAFWGMFISCMMIVIIGITLSCHFYKPLIGLLISIAIISAATGVMSMWYNSLYSGENLETAYHWSSDRHKPLQNLAYGKKAFIVSQDRSRESIYGYGGRAVDGNYSSFSGFISNFETNPFWIIDLHDVCQVGSIVIYESRSGPKWNRRPLELATSTDKKQWYKLSSILTTFTGKALRLTLKDPKAARYLRIKATGACYLSFDEVEILPPQSVSGSYKILSSDSSSLKVKFKEF